MSINKNLYSNVSSWYAKLGVLNMWNPRLLKKWENNNEAMAIVLLLWLNDIESCGLVPSDLLNSATIHSMMKEDLAYPTYKKVYAKILKFSKLLHKYYPENLNDQPSILAKIHELLDSSNIRLIDITNYSDYDEDYYRWHGKNTIDYLYRDAKTLLFKETSSTYLILYNIEELPKTKIRGEKYELHDDLTGHRFVCRKQEDLIKISSTLSLINHHIFLNSNLFNLILRDDTRHVLRNERASAIAPMDVMADATIENSRRALDDILKVENTSDTLNYICPDLDTFKKYLSIFLNKQKPEWLMEYAYSIFPTIKSYLCDNHSSESIEILKIIEHLELLNNPKDLIKQFLTNGLTDINLDNIQTIPLPELI